MNTKARTCRPCTNSATRRLRRKGFSLVEILIALGLVGLVGLVLMNFMANSQKSSENIRKIGEAAALDGAVRALLSNPTHCLETVKNIPGIPATGGAVPEEDIPGVFSVMQGSGLTTNVYAPGAVVGGVKILTLKATVGEEIRGSRLVHIAMSTRKVGDTLNRTDYTFDYYLDVKLVNGVPDGCTTINDGGGKLVLESIQNVRLLASSLPPVSPYPYRRLSLSVGQATTFGPPQWESGEILSQPPNCEYEDPTNRCGVHDAPELAVDADGNLLVYSFVGKVSMGMNGYPAGTLGSFGALLAIVVKDENHVVIRDDTFIKVSGTLLAGTFRHESLTTPVVALKTTPGKRYYFLQRFSVDASVPPSGGGYFMNWFPADGVIYHYTQAATP